MWRRGSASLTASGASNRRLKTCLNRKKRYVRERFGIDEDTCTGDHSCIRLSGCPSLTIKDNPDPLRKDPVASIVNSCVGCGVCGEVAHAAVLCPSFYKADIVYNPNPADRALAALRSFAIGKLQAWSDRRRRKRTIEAVSPAGDEQERHSSSLPVWKQELSADGLKSGPAMSHSPAGKQAEPIKVAILAMGGQGGGVLSNWLGPGGRAFRLPGAIHLRARRGPAYRRNRLLPGVLSRGMPSGITRLCWP